MSNFDIITCLHCGTDNRVAAVKLAVAKCGTCQMPFPNNTLYQILEIDSKASDKQIKEAYRKLAMKWHPDKHPDNTVVATAHFKRINNAYSVLSDSTTRVQYDQTLFNQSRTDYSETYKNQSNPADGHSSASASTGETEDPFDVYLEQLYSHAFDLAFSHNKNRAHIISILLSKGCPQHIAKTIAKLSVKKRRQIVSKAAVKPLIKSIIGFGIGGGITYFTYSAASLSGGYYLISYGPMFYGLIQFLFAMRLFVFGKLPSSR
ncbi:J domain-containing protein [Paenibacillus sp. MMO-58]|uniref:J domain-containing protein n=1 Tax=Paenibacillus sp. MMO-58 TaxID=3081290 RepID=UPI00301ABE84